MKLKLDLHDIYNSGRDIDQALHEIMYEAIKKRAPLVEIIPDFRRRALPVSLVVAHRSNLSRRVRAFMKWIEDVLTPYLE